MTSQRWKLCLMGALVALSVAFTACSQRVVLTEESSAPSSSAAAEEESSSEEAAEASQEEPAGVPFESQELGFAVTLPSLLDGHMRQETSQREAYGETISTVSFYYVGETGDAHVLSFEEMSTAVWEQVQAEGGPLGVELGTSDSGRVVVMNTLQSNPFAEGTADYDVMNEYPSQLSVVYDTFRFL